MLLNNPDKMAALAEKRTEFMHLRTVQTKLTGKRPAPQRTSSESPAKKQRSGERLSGGSSSSDDSTKGPATRKSRPVRVTRSRSTTIKASAENIPTQTRANNRIKRKQEGQSRSPLKPRTRKRKEEVADKPSPKKTTRTRKTDAAKAKRETMMPFGHVLDGEVSPQTKENIP